MNARKKIFQGILILGLMAVVATASYMVASAQQNHAPAVVAFQPDAQPSDPQMNATSTSSNSSTNTTLPGSTTQPGSRTIQIALSQAVLSSLLSQQFGAQQNTLTDFQVIPAANNGVVLKFDLNITADSINRVLPIEIDSTIGLDGQQDVQLQISHLKRDGLDAQPAQTLQLQTALNQLLASLLMPQIHTMLKGTQLVGVQTNVALCCVNSEMLVLLLELK